MRLSRQDVRGFIDRHDWKEAKSYKDTAPHQYIVKEWPEVEEDLFEEFVHHIREEGYPDNFYSKTYIYYRVDGWKYWTMGAPVEETTVINRARIEEDQP